MISKVNKDAPHTCVRILKQTGVIQKAIVLGGVATLSRLQEKGRETCVEA